jgi:prevent-host-death family protein
MRWIAAEEAGRSLPRLLRETEAGERFVITRRGRPVATLGPYPVPAAEPAGIEITPEEREAAIQRAIAMMRKGLPVSDDAPRPPFTRDEMHER